MASPLAHSLIGLALSRTGRVTSRVPPWLWLALAIGAANAPDLDFLIGLLTGDINRFHQGVSHSFLAAILFGGALAMAARAWGASAIRVGLRGTALYASHLLLDLFSRDNKAPFGQPLFWPVSSSEFTSGLSFFGGVRHGAPGDSLLTFLVHLFSWHNLVIMGLEVTVLAPILVFVWYMRRRSLRLRLTRSPSS